MTITTSIKVQIQNQFDKFIDRIDGENIPWYDMKKELEWLEEDIYENLSLRTSTELENMLEEEYDNGYDSGRDAGYEDGYSDGYDAGYEEGKDKYKGV